jgi:STAS domain
MEALFVCDVGALIEPDVAAVEALARLQLAARRSGCRIKLYDVQPQLGGLLELMGLGGIFPPESSSFEAWRKPEEREQPLGVEEETDPGDRTVPDLEDLQGPRIE